MAVFSRNKNQELIPGLPDEIAIDCLVKVPFKFHFNMKLVCNSWLNLFSDPSFNQLRRNSGNSEHLVCLVQPLPPADSAGVTTTVAAAVKKDDKQEDGEQNPHQEQQEQQIYKPPQFALTIFNINFNTWQRTSPAGGIPMFSQCLALPFSGKILTLGGWDPVTLEPVSDVYIFDLAGASGCGWRRGASMSVPRSFFACAAVGPSTVYVAGGHDGQKNALKSAEVYDVDKDKWTTLPDMIEERDECEGLAWDGDSKFWVVSGYGTDRQGQFRFDAEFYDPSSGCWSKVDGVWLFSSYSPRGVSATVAVNRDHHQLLWFLTGEQQRQLTADAGEVKEHESLRLEILSSVMVPEGVNCGNMCVVDIGPDDQNSRKVLLMSGNGGGRTPATGVTCNECDCEGAFIMDKEDCNNNSNGSCKWRHVHTPVGFSGFPFSACHVTI